MDDRKLELVTDFYELTMSNAYFIKGMKDTITYFDMFFRDIPDERRICCICRTRADSSVY